jgi:hypothetical protein
VTEKTWTDGVNGLSGGNCKLGLITQVRKHQLQKLIDSVVFVVEADSFARYQLNRMWCKKVAWEFDPRCHTINIGSFGGEPVNISLQFAVLNGNRIMFYSPSSPVANWDMIEKWLLANCNPTRQGGIRAHVNAENFHQVVEFVRARSS